MASQGKIATAFTQLITSIFREENGVALSPSSFKDIIGQFSVQFRGSDQHDSQEFLAFLLDGLHEDLNQGIGVRGGRGYQLTSMPDWARPVQGKDDDDDDTVPEEVTTMPPPSSSRSLLSLLLLSFSNQFSLSTCWFVDRRTESMVPISSTQRFAHRLAVPRPTQVRTEVCRVREDFHDLQSIHVSQSTHSWPGLGPTG